MSGRRAMSDIRNAKANGLLTKMPSFTSIFRYLEDPALTPLLKTLIEQSALPLKSVETDFAVDSSGFATSTYHRWFDHKWGREIKESQWVKCHLLCGVKTNIVTAVEVTATPTNDSPFLAPFVRATAQNFDVQEVSADKAYLSKKNLRAVQAVGGTLTSRSRPTRSAQTPRRSTTPSGAGCSTSTTSTGPSSWPTTTSGRMWRRPSQWSRHSSGHQSDPSLRRRRSTRPWSRFSAIIYAS